MPKLPWYTRAVLRMKAHAWALRNRSRLHSLSTPHIWVGVRKNPHARPIVPDGPSIPADGINIPIKKISPNRYAAITVGGKHQFGHVLQKIWHAKRERIHPFKINYRSELGELEERMLQGMGYGDLDLTPELARTTSISSLHRLLTSESGIFYHPGDVIVQLSIILPQRVFSRALIKMYVDPTLRPVLLEMNKRNSGTGIEDQDFDYRRWSIPIVEYFQRINARYTR